MKSYILNDKIYLILFSSSLELLLIKSCGEILKNLKLFESELVLKIRSIFLAESTALTALQ